MPDLRCRTAFVLVSMNVAAKIGGVCDSAAAVCGMPASKSLWGHILCLRFLFRYIFPLLFFLVLIVGSVIVRFTVDDECVNPFRDFKQPNDAERLQQTQHHQVYTTQRDSQACGSVSKR